MEDDEYKGLQELLADAPACHRLTQFEREVLETVRCGCAVYHELAVFSDRQWKIIREIRAKVYAT